jgi:hypothetical protein
VTWGPVLTLTDEATFSNTAPETVWLGDAGRIVLPPADLADTEIRVLPRTGAQLSPAPALWRASEQPGGGVRR